MIFDQFDSINSIFIIINLELFKTTDYFAYELKCEIDPVETTILKKLNLQMQIFSKFSILMAYYANLN